MEPFATPAHSGLLLILVLLFAAVLVVALFRTMRISPVLGYLAAGAAVGPHGLGWVVQVESTSAIAEYGVMFLLFVIGLELSYERLHALRRQVFAAGLLQVALTALALAACFAFATDLPRGACVILGGGLALSSTAFVMQLIAERHQKASQLGRLALAVLLIQDLSVVPLLVLVPALAHPQGGGLWRELGEAGLRGLVGLAVILLAGRIVLRPLYRMIASLKSPEIFTALTLLVVLGTGWLTFSAGLSLALGAFLAGLLLAETEYRHQVEADVMPYKALFLGLFFMTIGMSADMGLLVRHGGLILLMASGLMVMKMLIFFLVCRLCRMGLSLALRASFLLSQGGEFAFILFRLGAKEQLLSDTLAQYLMLTVTLSMALTPVAAAMGRALARFFGEERHRTAESARRDTNDLRDHVIILGFGRVGQMIAKLLSAEDMQYIALDMQASTVAKANGIGLPVYYGDGAQREVLSAVGIERASAAILTLNDAFAAERAVRAIRAAAPTLPIIARARDLAAVQELEAAGANIAVSEMFETSLQLGSALLREMGVVDQEISRIIALFRERDYALARGSTDLALQAPG